MPLQSAESATGTPIAGPTVSPDSAIIVGKRSRPWADPSSGNVPSNPKGGQWKRKVCSLEVCGSNLQYGRGPEGIYESCPGAVTHRDDDLLCAACHGTLGTPPRHLGDSRRPLAKAWVAECRHTGEGLPARVLNSFEPSESCLCSRTDCFYNALDRYRKEIGRRRCIPCGTKSTSRWNRAGSMYLMYQLFFLEGEGTNKTETGMAVTKEVVTAESWLCCA